MRDTRERQAQRVITDKDTAEATMLRVQRVIRDQNRQPLPSDLKNDELISLLRHFGITHNGAKVKAERFKVWYDFCVSKNLFVVDDVANITEVGVNTTTVDVAETGEDSTDVSETREQVVDGGVEETREEPVDGAEEVGDVDGTEEADDVDGAEEAVEDVVDGTQANDSSPTPTPELSRSADVVYEVPTPSTRRSGRTRKPRNRLITTDDI